VETLHVILEINSWIQHLGVPTSNHNHPGLVFNSSLAFCSGQPVSHVSMPDGRVSDSQPPSVFTVLLQLASPPSDVKWILEVTALLRPHERRRRGTTFECSHQCRRPGTFECSRAHSSQPSVSSRSSVVRCRLVEEQLYRRLPFIQITSGSVNIDMREIFTLGVRRVPTSQRIFELFLVSGAGSISGFSLKGFE
jgi:hypothetical protein